MGDRKVFRRLEEWQEKEGASPGLVSFYRRLLDIQSGMEQRVGLPESGLSREAINQRLEQGLPVVSSRDLKLDWRLVDDMFSQVSSLFAQHPELFGVPPKDFARIDSSRLREILEAWLDEGRLSAAMLTPHFSEPLLTDMIQAALKPFFVGYSRALRGLVEQSRWRRGYCPICQASPDFAYLEKERGARWLVCSRCDMEWLFQRLECPYCSNKDQSKLVYLTDDEGLYRLYMCERCKRYLKAIDLRHAKGEVTIALERLFTLSMDMQARDNGYS